MFKVLRLAERTKRKSVNNELLILQKPIQMMLLSLKEIKIPLTIISILNWSLQFFSLDYNLPAAYIVCFMDLKFKVESERQICEIFLGKFIYSWSLVRRLLKKLAKKMFPSFILSCYQCLSWGSNHGLKSDNNGNTKKK